MVPSKRTVFSGENARSILVLILRLSYFSAVANISCHPLSILCSAQQFFNQSKKLGIFVSYSNLLVNSPVHTDNCYIYSYRVFTLKHSCYNWYTYLTTVNLPIRATV